MADKLPVDSNAGTSSQVGVGRAQQIGRALHQINPNWVEDGYGIVGPQRQVIRPPDATPSGMEFGLSNANHNDATPVPNACLPDPPPDTGTWVWGTVDGECQWIDTTDCS